MKNNRLRFLLCLFPICFLFAAGCESLKTTKPIMSLKEYEKMLLGNIMADYVGDANCLKACHYHDELKAHLDASTMGVMLSSESGMPLVDCESCHGPGSLAVEGLTPEKVEADRQAGIQTACRHDTLLDLNALPAGAKSLICLKCHSANATFIIHNWNASEHALNDVSCSDCHPVHIGADLTTKPRDVKEMCLKCHQEVRAEFSLSSHHPVLENKIYCTDCHDGHGTTGEMLLRKFSVKETCIQCHTEKGGPFLFEHADAAEDCLNCHSNHGSINNNLLKLRDPFLCLQCHIGHWLNDRLGGNSSLENRSAYYTRCVDCHSEVHGSDNASATGTGRFLQ